MTPSAFIYLGTSLSCLYFWRTALPGIVFVADSSFLSIFWIYHPSSPGLKSFCWEICQLSCGGSFVCDLLSFFLASFKIFFVFDLWQFNYNVSWCCPTWVQFIGSSLRLVDLIFISPSLGKFSAIIALNIFPAFFLSLLLGFP